MLNIIIPPGYELSCMPDGGFAAVTGPLFVKETPNGPRFAFHAEPRHTNARDVVHGGMLMSFADQVLSLTVQRHIGTIDVATASLHCGFIASVRLGGLVEGGATLSRVGRMLIFVRGTLFCGERVVMNASGVWARLRKTPNMEEGGPDRRP